MTRELRLKLAGILFYLIFALNLAVSAKGIEFLIALPSGSEGSGTYQAIAAVLGLGALLFTTEAIGYIFSNLHLIWWNIIRGKFKHEKAGYSAEWENLGYNMKNTIIDNYDLSIHQAGGEAHQKFERQFKSYTPDVFLSYFWQQAPKGIVDWAMRRNTAYFSGCSTVTGLVLALILSGWIIHKCGFGWTDWNTSILVSTLFLSAIVYWNAQHSRKEAWQIIDLYLAEKFNSRFKQVLNQIDQPTGGADGE